MRSIPLTLVLLVTVGQVSSPAQVLETGDRVRLNGIQASVLAHRGDILQVRYDWRANGYPKEAARKLGFSYSDSTTSVAIGAVRRIEVLRGKRSAAKQYAQVGGLVGFLVGGVIGVGLNGAPDCDPGWFHGLCAMDDDLKDLGNGFLVGASGALLGGAIGFLVGTRFQTDNWVAVDFGELDLVVLPRPHGAEVGILVRF